MKTRITGETRREAERLFVIEGKNYLEITKILNLGLETANKWGAKFGWVEKRKEFCKKMTSTLYDKLVAQIEQSVQRFLAFSTISSQICLDIAIDFKNMPKEDLKKNFGYFSDAVSVAEKASRIHKNVVPDCSEQLSQKILGELESLNRELRKKRIKE